MALLPPIGRCQYDHPLCALHGSGPADEPGPMDGRPPAGVCAYGCIATRLWQTPRDGKWLCARHIRAALRAGDYPVPLDE